VRYVPGSTILAPLRSILSSIANGNYDLQRRRLTVRDSDLVGWTRSEFESLTLILLVDVSNSTWRFVEVFKDILKSLATYFSRHNDRMGLISLQGSQARIYVHPTHNFRVVARGLSRLEFHGYTPLADGLHKSLSVARLESSKNPGSRSVVILISDCHPEPVAMGCEDPLQDPAYRNSVAAAGHYRKSKTMLLVINPTCAISEKKSPGETLSEMLAHGSGGRLIKLRRRKSVHQLPPNRKEMETIFKGVEDSLK
jgi:Mg-chelatase subunit ChlD